MTIWPEDTDDDAPESNDSDGGGDDNTHSDDWGDTETGGEGTEDNG